MPALPTLRPNGQGTLTLVNNQANATTNTHLDIDDDPDAPNTADYVKNSTDTTGDKIGFWLFDDMPVGFATMTSLQVDCDIQVASFVNDTCTVFARMYQSDETTALSNEVQVATQAQTGLRSIAFTGIVAGSKAIWDGARLRFRWAYNRSAGADGAQMRVTAAELDGVYSDVIVHTAAVVMSGTGDLTSSAFVNRNAAATASGTGALTASAIRTTNASATMAGTGNLTASANVSIHHQAASLMTGVGNLTASGVVIPPITAAATLTGFGDLAATAQHVASGVDQSIDSIGEIGAKGYAGSMYAGAFFAGGGEFILALGDCETDEEIAGHEIAGICVPINALYPSFALPQQTYGCGNGYAGGQFAALLYGGGVPCNGQSPSPTPGGVQSNVEEFCILSVACV